MPVCLSRCGRLDRLDRGGLFRPLVERLCLRGVADDLQVNFPPWCVGHQSRVIRVAQARTRHHSAKSAMQKRIATTPKPSLKMLVLECLRVNRMFVAMAPDDLLFLTTEQNIRMHKHWSLSAMHSIGAVFLFRLLERPYRRAPNFCPGRRAEWVLAFHLDMHHRLVRIHPNSEFHAFTRRNPNLSVTQDEFLPERLALTKWIRLQREANAADLHKSALVAPGIALGNVENQIALRLHPSIEGDVPVAKRHRT